ncbi:MULTISPECIES: mannose-6-phosphate isomerase, class I [unclassified Microbacterium]|uniref:mannose-6-phosphate isomerase, class I n=1 Tax=unclassified Microbacterium TaxID=2609290 RepID=UPI0004935634|nr:MULTISPECIES: mannose-6-phosphate isomerase, class I [unclassified Microbacterium]MCV0333181.1 mannose-6-phosphate isomerase, class I [Microbacterium sp.]MCV0375626.1 mannose-6-phosphate isomerase, class I [Microbacterium sp.]MCV0389019.1 mannose-6-phosphate isomerase, class I [Microbacterium sp.]MCV0417547.1 mannose-6-phosphate isomerase, class I [Microbacterium sp.]MCV0420858.1 mannose-6-phosphate isomerase, class I [Microbacterium sp.]
MLLSLTNTPRDYAWGSDSLLAGLEGRTPTGAPEAEVWFGDHPGDPADVAGGGTLDQVTGGTLPYLLKLLAAGRPLSIQVHPTIEQARAGWARESGLDADDPQRNYRDDNHKPELLVALSDRFESLSGLRPVPDTLFLLDALDDSGGVRQLRTRLSAEGDALRDVIAWLLGGEADDEVDEIIGAIVTAAARGEAGEWSTTLRAIADVAATYPGDPGVVVALLMNHVVLERGEGVFLRAGLLHAYLSGLGVEIMAASDNVLRGGLTPKRIDVPELLTILDTTPGEVPVLRAESAGPVTPYPVPVSDFALERVVVDGAVLTLDVSGPTMVLATAGDVTVSSASGDELVLAVGTVAFADTDEATVTLSGVGEVFIAGPGR